MHLSWLRRQTRPDALLKPSLVVEDTTLDDDQLASMSTEDLIRAILNFDNGITSLENKLASMSTEDIIRETRFLKEESRRRKLCCHSYEEKVKEGKEIIREYDEKIKEIDMEYEEKIKEIDMEYEDLEYEEIDEEIDMEYEVKIKEVDKKYDEKTNEIYMEFQDKFTEYEKKTKEIEMELRKLIGED
ncbi:unnamed protein product [Arabis nemorensis]|uniref:Uncharacterized protein n=1 Tax=Arabis nemorensis TaxID=586526 RepID=A0A565BQX9_9BRAS|nr:unnamed protein product [Arabis nemorensis]